MSMPPAPPSSPGPSGALAVAMLKETNNASNSVVFDFNPLAIKIVHQHQRQPVNSGNSKSNASKPGASGGGGSSSSGGGGGSKQPLGHEERIAAAGPTTITLNNLIFTGSGTVDNCKTLLGWSYPNIKDGSATNAEMTQLTFTWGDKINYPVTMVSADVTYDRFSSSGNPIRATVVLSLRYEGTTPPGTNPTSGGIPGRRRHILVSGENLQHIATANYGRPGAWRALAAANGIENPLAVQPGTVIYLPAAAELADGSTR